jgi:glutaconate CoA-transferase, subunit B
VEAGFIGGAEVDRHGNLNTTAIGDHRARPTVQLPGSGGGADIASLAHRLIVIMAHDKRRLRERVDFVTSPGYGEGGDWRARVGLSRGGPSVIITTLGVFRFVRGEAVLVSYHPMTSVDEIARNTGWTLTVADDVRETESPSEAELRIIRDYDPQGFWTRREQV